MKNCKTCNKEFTPKRVTQGKFCSYECYWNSKKRRKDYKCIDCSKTISPIKRVKRCHPCQTRYQCGSKSGLWKGKMVKYRALHHWVSRWLGKPNKCSECGIVGYGRKIHWANKSGIYKRELSDWIRLCSKCHGEYDRKNGFRRHKILTKLP